MVLFFIGSSSYNRQWPSECFAYISQFLQKYKLNLVIAGGPGDEDRREYCNLVKEYQLYQYNGKTSLPQLVDIISKVDIVISGIQQQLILPAY